MYNRLVYWPGKITKRRSRDNREVTTDVVALSTSAGTGPSKVLMGVSLVVGLLIAPLAMAVVKQKLLVSSSSRFDLPTERSPDSKLFASKTFPGLLLNQYQSNTGSNSVGGMSVHLWNFSGIDAEARIVLVYPVDGWKSEWSLGTEENWKVTKQNEASMQSPWPFVEKTLVYQRETAAKTELLFSSQFTLDGIPYIPTSEDLAEQPESTFGNRWLEPRLLNYLKTAPQDKADSSFVVQMQFVSKSELRDQDVVALRKIFEGVRQAILSRVSSGG